MINCLLSVKGSGLNNSQLSHWQPCSFLRIVIDACIIENARIEFWGGILADSFQLIYMPYFHGRQFQAFISHLDWTVSVTGIHKDYWWKPAKGWEEVIILAGWEWGGVRLHSSICTYRRKEGRFNGGIRLIAGEARNVIDGYWLQFSEHLIFHSTWRLFGEQRASNEVTWYGHLYWEF